MKTDLLNATNLVISYADSMLSMAPTSYRLRKEASECYLSIAMLHDNFTLEPASKISLEYLMNKIVDKICYEEYFRYYMGFYYLPRHVFDKDAEALSSGIYDSNVNISCFRCKIHASGILNFTLDSSADSYFFSRGDKVTAAVRNFIKYPFEFDASSILYLILNYYQALKEYNSCADHTYKIIATKLTEDVECLFSEILMYTPFKIVLEDNQQLSFFWNSTVPAQHRVTVQRRDFPFNLSDRYLWILYSMFSIDADVAYKTLIKCYDSVVSTQGKAIRSSLVMRILCQAQLFKGELDFSDIEFNKISSDSQDGVKFGLDHFFKMFNEIQTRACTQDEIDLLCSFDDHTLRQKVAACMKNVDPNELDRQFRKPHGTLEISDLDIRFSEAGKTKYLCMPFKTGREITKASVDESYMYQVLKPFAHFGSLCMVVFVTAKKCSQGLETYVEQISARQPSWRIELLQEAQLCKLLIANNQLY